MSVILILTYLQISAVLNVQFDIGYYKNIPTEANGYAARTAVLSAARFM